MHEPQLSRVLSPYSAKPKCEQTQKLLHTCVLDQGFDKFNHFLEASLPDPSTAAARSVELEREMAGSGFPYTVHNCWLSEN